MKKIIILSLIFCAFIACQPSQKTELRAPQPIKGIVYGDSVLDNNIRDIEGMLALAKEGSSTKLKVRGVVDGICKDKGAWLSIKIQDNESMKVDFKESAFVVPKDIMGKQVVLDGEVKRETLSVETQKDLAHKGGLNQDTIDKITTVKKVLAFQAKGVVIL